MPNFNMPDFLPYLLSLLGLLLVWELHSIQVRAGRIKAVDILNRSGIGLFLHVTPDDAFACPVCREANRTAFLPTTVASKKFKATAEPCTNPAGCRCITIGLHGAWAEAQRLQIQLLNGGRVHLTAEEFGKVLDGAVARPAGVAADQVSLAMLQAMRTEGSKPELAIERYQFVIDHAKTDMEKKLLIPAYLRITELLDKLGRKAEALSVVDRFMKVFERNDSPQKPTEAQLSTMELRKTRLMMFQT
ncbi:MAG TPA: hypothetical protein VGQ60_03785 [Nitrospiraceae bacterium]|jgi:hypothetical protein|nr:hypothetical protein [Nitrospiraceae bacterium]